MYYCHILYLSPKQLLTYVTAGGLLHVYMLHIIFLEYHSYHSCHCSVTFRVLSDHSTISVLYCIINVIGRLRNFQFCAKSIHFAYLNTNEGVCILRVWHPGIVSCLASRRLNLRVKFFVNYLSARFICKIH